jgi:hypothetical protein
VVVFEALPFSFFFFGFLRSAVNSVEKFGNGERGYDPGSISATFEYAFDEWSVSELARALGKTEVWLCFFFLCFELSGGEMVVCYLLRF